MIHIIFKYIDLIVFVDANDVFVDDSKIILFPIFFILDLIQNMSVHALCKMI